MSQKRTQWVRLFLIGIILPFVIGACTTTKAATTESTTTDPIVTDTPIPENNNDIALHYQERVPYMVTTAIGVEGLTASPAAIAFEKAGIPFHWQLTPSNRQLDIVQNNTGKDCLLGWFKNPEREAFAKFTLPLYQDKPMGALSRADNTKIPDNPSVDGMLTDPNLILLVKDRYSYGSFLDEKIAEYAPNTETTTDENTNMLQIVHLQRADYFFIAPEEASSLISAAGFTEEDFKFIEFADMPLGNSRYIMCSFQVEDAVIEQLNAAIRQYVTDAPEE